MNIVVFSIIYSTFLILEVSFLNRFFSVPLPLAFWFFIFASVIMPREKVLYFGAYSLFFSSIFFTDFYRLPLALFLGTLTMFLVKSVKGMKREFSAVILFLILAVIYEIPNIWDYFYGFYRFSVLINEIIAGLVFVSVMILFFLIFARIGVKTEYKI